MPESAAQRLWAPQAWVAGRWEPSVLLDVDAAGRWATIAPGVSQPPEACRVLPGPVLPGLVDAHSHAFQRAFAGLSERRDADADDFWSWRDRMYRVAQRITPQQMQAVASYLYVELLRGGYTQVCEFHYLHHGVQGQPFAHRATMCHALAQAASASGIGLTVLPVLYERAGFAQPQLRDDQMRFSSSPALVLQLAREMQALAQPRLNAGVAIHSLRAASPSAITELLWQVADQDWPIHIHVAEQTQEVADCLASTGRRPIDWLCHELAPDARWHLVHATHATAAEIEAVGRSGAGIVICPGTEANLGDGLTDVAGWLQAGVPMAIGSDSHVTRNWPEELRWLEYGQRLQRRQRNVAASPLRQPSTAARLWEGALSAGARAAGQPRWGLAVGARADALVMDYSSPSLVGLPASHLLDGLVFAGAEPAWREVIVAGEVVLRDGRHAAQERITEDYRQVMESLWAGA